LKKEKFTFYKEYPKTCDPEDFWGQVKRTVNGVRVSQEQIDYIVDAVVNGLELTRNDNLLDLCCGNGALSTLIFKYCNMGVGVDFSEYLINVAKRNFEKKHIETYILSDALEYCKKAYNSDMFNKVLCYGSFSYIEHHKAEKILCVLNERFKNIERIYIGNCPDKALLSEFVKNRNFEPGSENDPDSPIGIWRTREEFTEIAEGCGWRISFYTMPDSFYAAHYRYDVILINDH